MHTDMISPDLMESLKKDFVIHKDVTGEYRASENIETVTLGMILKAKDHLIDVGFTSEWFGIEALNSNTEGDISKITKIIWNSLTYTHAYFAIDEETVRPAFIAVFAPDDKHSKYSESHLKSLLQLGHYGNVGRIMKYQNYSWVIKFSSIYATSENSKITIKNRFAPKVQVCNV